MEIKGVGIPPSEGEGSTEAVWTFILVSSSWFSPSFRPVSFSIPDLPWDPPLGVHTPLSQDGSRSKGLWHKQDSCGLELSPDF